MNYRETTNAYCNCEKRIYDGVGDFNIPEMHTEEIDLTGCENIGFNYAKGCKKPGDKILHFYLDDYQFDRVWNRPYQYLELLSKFKAVLAPHFSTYEDFPLAVRIYNTYRKMWLAKFWQENGICVIPTLNWSEKEGETFYFDGIPKNALVSVSTVGGWKDSETTGKWLEGFARTIKELQPSSILLYGKMRPEIREIYPGDVILMEDNAITRLDALKKRKKIKQKNNGAEEKRKAV